MAVKEKKEKFVKASQEDLLKLGNDRLSRSVKFSEKYHKEVEKWLKDYEIDSVDDIDWGDVHNRFQVPYIFSTIESGMPTIFETIPSIIMKQRGKNDKELTDFADSVWKYLSDILDLPEEIEDVGMMFLITGMGHLGYDWKLKTKTVEEEEEVPMMNPNNEPVLDENQQPITQIVKTPVKVPVINRPQLIFTKFDRIFFSPESRFVIDDEDNKIPYIIFKKVMDPDSIEQKYGKKVPDEDLSYVDTEDTDKPELKDVAKEDRQRAGVYVYNGTLPKKYVGEGWDPDSVYHFVFSKSKILENVKEIDKKPFLNLGNYGTPLKFFKFGEPKVLREMEQDISLGRSLIADYRDRMMTKIAIPAGTELDEENFKKPLMFTIVKFSGQTLPSYINPPPLPQTILTALGESRNDIQMASAMMDVSRGGDVNTVNTATGQKIFAAVTEKRLNRKRIKIGRFIRALAINLLILCANNWDEDDFSKITDIPAEEIAQKGFIEKLKQLGDGYDIEVDIEGINDNKETESAQAIALYDKLKDSQYVNQDELVKEVIKIGFRKKDAERFLSGNISPDMVFNVLGYLVEQGMMQQEVAQQVVMIMQQTMNPDGSQGTPTAGDVGRPAVKDPTSIVEKTMKSDNTQITAQNEAAGKQMGIPKIQNKQ